MNFHQSKLPLVNSYIEKYAQETPDNIAMIQHEDGRTFTYKEFEEMIDLYALRLAKMGIKEGDRVSTMLLLFPEHLILMYACFKVGAIVAPIDIRLKEDEVVRDLDKIKPKAFFFHGKASMRDFSSVGKAVKDRCSYVEHLVQFPLEPGDNIIEGAYDFWEEFNPEKLASLKNDTTLIERLNNIYRMIGPRTAALIIYTTGTTGEPKPAVLCHENIITQNEILAKAGLRGQDWRLVCNMPCSHVAGTSEGPMTTFYVGGTAVLLRIFDPKLTLEAVQERKATMLGMIPTQYRMIWNVPEYEEYDLSSLRFVIYAGAAGDLQFLKKLSEMAPYYGTGLGMTENAGFATFTPHGLPPEEMVGQMGEAFPDVAPVTVREPMKEDGSAGEELPDGEVGEVCYHPPIAFLGYYDQPEETEKVLSKEGILYTGDMGYFKDMGTYRTLYLSGRKKFMIKQKGYNVFPDEVAAFIGEHPKVALAEVVGAPHNIYDEGIVAFVQPKEGVTLTAEEIYEHCKNIASYKRPQHVEIWDQNTQLPLNRTGKINKVELQEMAKKIVESLRKEGKWDQS